MRTVRLPLQFDGQVWRVRLPNYVMVPGSVLPIIKNKIGPDGILPSADPLDPALAAATVEVAVPDDELNDDGTPNRDIIATRYPDFHLPDD